MGCAHRLALLITLQWWAQPTLPFMRLPHAYTLDNRTGLRLGPSSPVIPDRLLAFKILRNFTGIRQGPSNRAVDLLQGQSGILLLDGLWTVSLFETRYQGVQHNPCIAYAHHTMFISTDVSLWR